MPKSELKYEHIFDQTNKIASASLNYRATLLSRLRAATMPH